MNVEDSAGPPGGPGPDSTIEALRKKAREALSDAETLQEHGSPSATINRGYYATFQAARAALLTKGESPKHGANPVRWTFLHFPNR